MKTSYKILIGVLLYFLLLPFIFTFLHAAFSQESETLHGPRIGVNTDGVLILDKSNSSSKEVKKTKSPQIETFSEKSNDKSPLQESGQAASESEPTPAPTDSTVSGSLDD